MNLRTGSEDLYNRAVMVYFEHEGPLPAPGILNLSPGRSYTDANLFRPYYNAGRWRIDHFSTYIVTARRLEPRLGALRQRRCVCRGPGRKPDRPLAEKALDAESAALSFVVESHEAAAPWPRPRRYSGLMIRRPRPVNLSTGRFSGYTPKKAVTESRAAFPDQDGGTRSGKQFAREETNMEETLVLYEKKGPVAWVGLNRPQALNGMTPELSAEFCRVLDGCDADEEVVVVVLYGVGKAFCAGGDLREISAQKTADEAAGFVKKVGRMVEKIREIKKPVVAMVNGAAAGAGFNLAAACDIVLASDKAKFIQSFSSVGLVPDCGGHYFLPRLIGPYRAKELMFTARPVTAQEGYELGFVNHVYPHDELKAKTEEFAKMLAGRAPLALYCGKNLVNQSAELSLGEVLELEASIQGELMMTEDGKEGFAAFFEKRPPRFQGK